MNNSPQRAAKGFTRAFWVSNTVELFERMAYYAEIGRASCRERV